MTPTCFGVYHILSLCIIFGLCALVLWKGKKVSDKQFDCIIGITAGVLLLFELYKQLILSYNAEKGTWAYYWTQFPFQFCSTPMYVMLLISLLKNGKLKNSLCSFIATYSLFAGIAVCIYPGTVFVDHLGINLQTMVHHGAMLIVGVFMYACGKVKPCHKTVLYALPTFLVLIAMAITMNSIYAAYGDTKYTFTMFYIAPGLSCPFPVFDILLEKAPYPVFLLTYVSLFTLAGYLVSMAAYLIIKLRKRMTTLSKES